MKSLGEQFEAIIKPRIDKVNEQVAPKIAEDIAQRMKQNTLSGTAFGNDPYESSYQSASHRSKRRKQGLQVGTVDMRMGKRRIEQTKIEKVGGGKQGAEVQFQDADAAIIFNYHHKGTATGNHMRSIFPKSAESIPKETKVNAMKLVKEVLSGKK